MKVSPMSEEFHDWLDKCPVTWFRDQITKDHVTYAFETPEEDELALPKSDEPTPIREDE